MNELAHAKLSASGAHRWIECPGSVSLEEGLPDKKTEYAEYGTAGHTLAQTALEEGLPVVKYKGDRLNKSEEFPDGFLVDDEMIEAVQQYVDYCNGLGAGHKFIEKRVDFSEWVPEGFGTSDYIHVEKDNGGHIIHCVDLKMGKGVRVYAKDNPQGMLYALGVLNEMNMAFEFSDNDRVVISIVQPRLDHIDEWEITVKGLLTWANDVVRPAAQKAMDGVMEFGPDEKPCKFCKARSTCKALAELNMDAVAKVFRPIPDPDMELKETHELTNEDISKLIPLTDGIIEWCKALQAYAFQLMEGGTPIEGYKIVRGRAGNRKWVDEQQVSVILSEYFSTDELFQPAKLLTPPNMVKLLKINGQSDDLISPLWTQSEGKLTMAKEEDPREEVTPTSGAEFKTIEP